MDFANIKRLVAAGNQAEINRLFDNPYPEATPTKLPGGRLVLTLSAERKAEPFALDLRRAVGSVALSGGALEGFFHADQPVAMLRIDDPTVTAPIPWRPEGSRCGVRWRRAAESRAIIAPIP